MARELAGSGVNLLIGGSQSPMALATAPILPELKALMVAPCPTVMSLTHEGFQKNFFRLSWNAYIAFAGIGNMLPALTLGIPTVIHPLGAFDPAALLDVLAAELSYHVYLCAPGK